MIPYFWGGRWRWSQVLITRAIPPSWGLLANPPSHTPGHLLVSLSLTCSLSQCAYGAHLAAFVWLHSSSLLGRPCSAAGEVCLPHLQAPSSAALKQGGKMKVFSFHFFSFHEEEWGQGKGNKERLKKIHPSNPFYPIFICLFVFLKTEDEEEKGI